MEQGEATVVKDTTGAVRMALVLEDKKIEAQLKDEKVKSIEINVNLEKRIERSSHSNGRRSV